MKYIDTCHNLYIYITLIFMDTLFFFGKHRLWWNWELDVDWYPQWEEMIATIHPARLTTYMNPYLANTVQKNKKNYRRDLFAEASSYNYLIQNITGQPYIQSSASSSFTFGTIDLTNPDARQWTRNVIRCNMLGDQNGCPTNVTAIRGAQSGFMSDFGEYLPWDAIVASGEPASTVHNKFPSLWAQTCREAIHEAELDNEVTFFSRSASATSPTYSTLFWAGDQLTSWDAYDGMQSALSAILSGGLSGMSMSHSDTGGYTEFRARIYNMLRTEEMLIRWMEMETFSGVMLRTHPGLLPDLSAQVNTSLATLNATRLCSKLHILLHPYRLLLMNQATNNGYPLVRYMFLEFPKDIQSWKVVTQFMLGDMFLVAPIAKHKAHARDVYLPPNTDWLHVFTHVAYQGGSGEVGKNVTMESPIGTPIVLQRMNYSTTNGVAMKVANAMHAYWKEEQLLLLSSQH